MTLDPEKNPNVDPRQCSYSHYERAEKLLIAMMAAGQIWILFSYGETQSPNICGKETCTVQLFTLTLTHSHSSSQQAREYCLNASTSLLEGWHCSGYSLRKGRSPAW